MSTMLNHTLEGKTVGEVLEGLLDINLSVSEDCLHLAVSTPFIPGGVSTLSWRTLAAGDEQLYRSSGKSS